MGLGRKTTSHCVVGGFDGIVHVKGLVQDLVSIELGEVRDFNSATTQIFIEAIMLWAFSEEWRRRNGAVNVCTTQSSTEQHQVDCF